MKKTIKVNEHYKIVVYSKDFGFEINTMEKGFLWTWNLTHTIKIVFSDFQTKDPIINRDLYGYGVEYWYSKQFDLIKRIEELKSEILDRAEREHVSKNYIKETFDKIN